MALIEGKFIRSGAIDASKINLGNDTFLKGRNNADNADVNIIKVNTSDALELAAKLNDPSNVAPSIDTQLANKKYVDDQVASISIPSVFTVKGNWNANTNSPTLVASTNSTGDSNPLYIVTVTGTTSLDSISSWDAGDWIYFANGVWNRADNIDDVTSVNSQTGAIVLDTGDISENGNLYYTQGRFDTAFGLKDTGDLTEGTSLYFTEQRVQDSILSDYVVGANTALANTDAIDAAFGKVQGQINALSSASQDFGQEVVTLVAGDITNGYYDLAQTPIAASLFVAPVGGPVQEVGVDYTLSTNRVTFAGDLASLLIAGDKLIFKYAY